MTVDDRQSYEDLVVWQRAVALVPEIYRLIASFPRVETYALSDQLRRAAVSISANIAEGQARRHRKEFRQHLSVAKGSLAEIHTLLVVAEKLGYMTGEHLALLESMLREIRRPLFGLIASLEKRSTVLGFVGHATAFEPRLAAGKMDSQRGCITCSEGP